MSKAKQQGAASEEAQGAQAAGSQTPRERSSSRKAPTIAEICAELADMSLNVGFDKLENRPMKTGPLPWDKSDTVRRITDVDDIRLFSLLQETIGLRKRADLDMALAIHCDDHAYDPLQDMLNALKWDGVERAESLFVDYLGAADTPYTHAVASVFLSEAIARAFHPGVKADYMPILVGPGGIGKSRLVRALAVEKRFFTDSIKNLGNVKTTGEDNDGKWIAELPELSGMNGRSLEGVKAGITRQADEYRESYARRTASHPRRVVYIGTTNEAGFIRERTSGARRFLPILCSVVEPTKDLFACDAKAEMKQVWAEVKTWMEQEDSRFSTVLDREMEVEAANQRACFMDEDPREQIINAYLAENEDHLVCTFEIIDKALHMDRSAALCKEVGSILSSRCPGWVLAGKRLCGAYGKQRCWEKR